MQRIGSLQTTIEAPGRIGEIGAPGEATVAAIIAQALVDADVKVVTHVPGFGGNQIFEAYCELAGEQPEISFNEEVGYTIAHGAGLVGARAATIIKAHGIVKAGNSVIDSLVAGTTAGFVNIVVDDKHGKHSDCIFDIQAYLRGVGIPYIVVRRDTVYEDVLQAFMNSEEKALPYALVVEAGEVGRAAAFKRRRVPPVAVTYQPDITRHYLQPVFGEYQKQVLEAKLNGGDWRAISKPPIPVIPDDMPERWWRNMQPYEALFEVLKEMRPQLLTGDTGVSHLFAFPPFDCCDLSTYLGGSIPLAIGAYLGGVVDVWALIGDFSFIGAGHMGLAEAIQRGIPLKTIVFLNGMAAGTGGQAIPYLAWQRVLGGYRPYITSINDPQDKGEIRAVLEDLENADKMRIVIADYRDRP